MSLKTGMRNTVKKSFIEGAVMLMSCNGVVAMYNYSWVIH